MNIHKESSTSNPKSSDNQTGLTKKEMQRINSLSSDQIRALINQNVKLIDSEYEQIGSSNLVLEESVNNLQNELKRKMSENE